MKPARSEKAAAGAVDVEAMAVTVEGAAAEAAVVEVVTEEGVAAEAAMVVTGR
jgi:hypothetical protein